MVDAAVRINSILSPANVNATFSRDNPDFTAVFSNLGSGDTYGETPPTFWGGAPGTGFGSPGNTASIYINNITTEVNGQNVGYAVGEVTSHEFSHFLFGSRFRGESYDASNIVVEGGDARKMLNPNVGFTPTDLQRVHDLCKKLHPGGGGGNGAQGGGGTTFTFSPVMFGYSNGEGGYGEWVLFPGMTVVVVHKR
jgi:hypothetical protein